MSQHRLDYRTPTPQLGRSGCGVSMVAMAIMIALLIALNILLVHAAYVDRSWGAIGIAVMYGPMANGIFALAWSGGSLLVKHLGGGPSFARLMFLSIVLPIAAVAVDFLIISSMQLHGC